MGELGYGSDLGQPLSTSFGRKYVQSRPTGHAIRILYYVHIFVHNYLEIGPPVLIEFWH